MILGNDFYVYDQNLIITVWVKSCFRLAYLKQRVDIFNNI